MLRTGWANLLVLGFVFTVGAAEKEASKKPVDPLDKQLQAARARQRGLYEQKSKRVRALEQGKELADVRAAKEKADKAAQDKMRSLFDEARQAEKAARAAFDKVVAGKYAESKERAALATEIADLEKERAEQSFQEDLAKLRLNHRDSPVQQALENDAGLVKLKQAISAAPVKERIKAQRAYDAARKEKFAGLAEVQKLQAAIKAADEAEDLAQKKIFAARNKLAGLRRQLEKSDDADIKAARAKLDESRKQLGQVYRNEDLAKQRELASSARRAYDKKLAEAVADDAELGKIRKALEEVRREIRKLELDRQIRHLEEQRRQLDKKKPATDA